MAPSKLFPGTTAAWVDRVNRVMDSCGEPDGKIKESHIRNGRHRARAPFEPHSVPNLPRLRALIEALANEFGVDVEIATKLLLDDDSSELSGDHAFALLSVLRANLQSGKKYIDGFTEAWEAGITHTTKTLLQCLNQGHVTQELLDRAAGGRFEPHQVARHTAGYVRTLLRRTGISDPALLERCVETLLQPRLPRKTDNPAWLACLVAFSQAVLHNHLPRRENLGNDDILAKLGRYGLTRERYLAARRGRFTPHCVVDTEAARFQIEKLSRALGIDPGPALDLLLESRG